MFMRISVKSPDVQTFLAEALVPLYCRSNSVNKLCSLMNEALNRLGDTHTIHPGRLHALFSDDVSQGINDTSFKAAVRAARKILSDEDVRKEAESALRLATETMDCAGSQDIKTIAIALKMPPAVVSVIMELKKPDTAIAVPEDPLELFLQDCFNAGEIRRRIAAGEGDQIVKLPVPLGGHEAFLLDMPSSNTLLMELRRLRKDIGAAEMAERFARLLYLLAQRGDGIPYRIWSRVEHLIDPRASSDRLFSLMRSKQGGTL
jgi:hypothetical protein